jgi:urocanate hydratase
MTAGSYMYIGPQGIVHGTTITILNALRLIGKEGKSGKAGLFVSSGLGGMSGAQPKAACIAGVASVVAEINPRAIQTRYSQGWVDEVFTDLESLVSRVRAVKASGEVISMAYQGNIVDVWERFSAENIMVDIGSDQTSLHNPWAGGYYPAGLTFDEANRMLSGEPDKFRETVRKSLIRQVKAINDHASRGTYFFDYGNAFLLEASRAGAEVSDGKGGFRYPSYVQDIMGPLCFDYGFGPFRWVCCSNDPADLALTDRIALGELRRLAEKAPAEIQQQLEDNIRWIGEAGKNRLVVGSQARILYADAEGRIAIADAFNRAVNAGEISAPVVIGRDHHDVSGTDSPYRETSNIYDGSKFTGDMAVQNVIGDSFRGATWVSLHNGGGVGWGEVINGGFGMVLDGSPETTEKLKMMLHWDVNNGIARRSWARNKEALFAARREMDRSPGLQITMPAIADENLIEEIFKNNRG